MDQNLVQSLIQYNVNFLQDFLEDYSHLRIEEVDRLQSRIADAAYEAENVIESHIVDQILARSTTHGERISSTVDLGQGLQKVLQDMDLIKKEVMEIKEKEVQNEKHIRSSIPAATSFKSSSIGKNTMVGFDGVSKEIMDKLTQRQSNLQIIAVVGMGGIVHLRPCFLYMGVFNEDDKICVPELIKLWVAEGFLKPISGKCMEKVAQEYLKVLVDRNLILVDEWTRNGEINFCKMHDLLRELCLREARKDKLLCATRVQNLDNFSQDINIQRRIAIHQHTIWEQNDGYYLLKIQNALRSAPLVRSLICVSSEILPNFRLSRVLKGYDMRRGQNYSTESLLHLVNLRYFAFLPIGLFSSHRILSLMYLLWNLQTLIIDYFITSNVDIWKMPLLRHVKYMGLYLNNPKQDDFVLENLQTLSEVENFKCDEEVVKRIPNIRKLKVFYNYDALTASHYCLNNLSHLHKLESFNCGFLWELNWRTGLVRNLTFPHSLKKLTLLGCRLYWKDMSIMIGSLPHLQVLKLGPNSFMGPEWETIEGQFVSLKFLKIETCSELEYWITDATHFPHLEHLFLENLWILREIPSDLGNISTLKLIEVARCSKAIMVSAKKIAEEQDDLGNQDLQVRVLDNPYRLYLSS